LSLHAVDEAIYGVVLFMAVATTLIAPPFPVRLFKDERRVDEESLFIVNCSFYILNLSLKNCSEPNEKFKV
jgi:hypothetical protein